MNIPKPDRPERDAGSVSEGWGIMIKIGREF